MVQPALKDLARQLSTMVSKTWNVNIL